MYLKKEDAPGILKGRLRFAPISVDYTRSV